MQSNQIRMLLDAEREAGPSLCASGTLKHTASFSIWLCFPKKADLLGCKKIGKLSAAYFILDTVQSPSQQCHTSLPQPDRALPVACQELLLLKLEGNHFQVPRTLFTQGQIRTVYQKSKASLCTEARFKVLASSKETWVNLL